MLLLYILNQCRAILDLVILSVVSSLIVDQSVGLSLEITCLTANPIAGVNSKWVGCYDTRLREVGGYSYTDIHLDRSLHLSTPCSSLITHTLVNLHSH